MRLKNKTIIVGPLPPPYNGQSVAFDMLAQELKERNVQFNIVNIAVEENAKWRSLSLKRIIQYIPILFRFFLYSLMGSKNSYITISQSKSGFFRDFIMIWIAKLTGCKNIVCHLHGGNYGNFYMNQSRFIKFLIRITLRKTTSILILGENLRSMFSFDKELMKKVFVLPNGLPFELENNIKPKYLPLDNSAPVQILYLSNLIVSKGYPDLLEAINILVNKYQVNVICHFCGKFLAKGNNSENAEKHFYQKIKEYHLENNVFYHGVVTGKTKEKFLTESHFFVLPTNYDNEGQPISIIEAMAFGNVVITTNYRAIPEMVKDGVNGSFVPYGQPESIAKSIYKIISDPDKYSKMSHASINEYKKKFTKKKHLDMLLKYFL